MAGRIPVIVLTAQGGEQNAQEAYASGCSDYLTKPVNDVELLDLLKASSESEQPRVSRSRVYQESSRWSDFS
jgi:CheY-like chemotaxis protein